MSKRTQTILNVRPILRCFVTISPFFGLFQAVISLLILPELSLAGPVSDAQQQLNKAYNDYYQAISDGKKTPQEQKRLREEIVNPAMQAVSKAMTQETEQVTRAAQAGAPIPGGVPNAGVSGIPVESQAPVETALDGKGVPRELEFPGAPKGAPIPKPTHAGTYLGPYAPK